MKKEIENQKSYIGIDVSKLTIDVCIITAQGEQDYQQFENTSKDFKNMELWLNKKSYFCYQEALFCMEHTGLYTRELVSFLLQRESKVWMESALHLKRSMGMTRGKNDKVDSYRIARYAMTNNDKAVLLKLSSGTLLKLKDLMANRERLSKNYQSLKIATQELVRVDKSIGKELIKLNDAALKGILKSKVKVEKRMLQLINEDEELKTLFSLITSVKCVGDVLATELIVRFAARTCAVLEHSSTETFK
jgi:transposase